VDRGSDDGLVIRIRVGEAGRRDHAWNRGTAPVTRFHKPQNDDASEPGGRGTLCLAGRSRSLPIVFWMWLMAS